MKLALGTVQFGLPYGIANQTGQVAFEEAQRIVQSAREHGVDTLDTAMSYGTSEKVLGQIGISDFHIVSKVPRIPCEEKNIKAWMMQMVEQSVQLLGIPKLYGLLLHSTDQLDSPLGENIADALKEMKVQGLVQKTGVSIYQPSDLEYASRCLDLDIIQTPLNVIDQRLIQSGWLEKLHKSNVEIHTRSVFLQGLLLMPHDKFPDSLNKWQHIWDKWHEWLKVNNVSALVTCLQFTKSQNAVSRVVVGVDSLRHLKELLEIWEKPRIPKFPDIPCNEEGLINPANWR